MSFLLVVVFLSFLIENHSNLKSTKPSSTTCITRSSRGQLKEELTRNLNDTKIAVANIKPTNDEKSTKVTLSTDENENTKSVSSTSDKELPVKSRSVKTPCRNVSKLKDTPAKCQRDSPRKHTPVKTVAARTLRTPVKKIDDNSTSTKNVTKSKKFCRKYVCFVYILHNFF